MKVPRGIDVSGMPGIVGQRVYQACFLKEVPRIR